MSAMNLSRLRHFALKRSATTSRRRLCTSVGGEKIAEEKPSGLAQAIERQEQQLSTPQTFASLLRSSPFIELGDAQGKIVYGEIFNAVENDLYIDFGWKFHCVCTKPAKNASDYVIGAKVRVMINDLELSTRFLGSNSDLTLLEADCRLLNVVKPFN